MLGLVGLALFMLSGWKTDLSGNPTPTTTLKKVAVAVATNQSGEFSLKNEATFAAQLCFDEAQPETQAITTTKCL